MFIWLLEPSGDPTRVIGSISHLTGCGGGGGGGGWGGGGVGGSNKSLKRLLNFEVCF